MDNHSPLLEPRIKKEGTNTDNHSIQARLKSNQKDMLTAIHPKLPMRDIAATKDFYIGLLGFKKFGSGDYNDYLMLEKDRIQIHFFEFRALDPKKNYGQVYIRTVTIEELYQSLIDRKVPIHPSGPLQVKPWGQKEFSLLDPDNNLLTFGESV